MAAFKRLAEIADAAELSVANGGTFDRAEKGHQKGKKQRPFLKKIMSKFGLNTGLFSTFMV